ncbi:hypothetical protein [Streptomyces wuyuanensis]|uniref:hypothetical protein n=1 Tax=Streptomyces wuyuanensis TaxID=1196353 RepID=UPI003414B9A3
MTYLPDCWTCSRIIDNGVRRHAVAVASWQHWHGGSTPLCQSCLNAWFDNADDDESLEPKAWHWLTA